MRNTVLLAISFSLVILIYGCRDHVVPPKDTIVINKNEKYKDTTVKLDNFADDLKLIRLETNKNCLLSNFGGYVGEKYIISMEREKIIQFSGDGSFINTIAENGRGPKEFNRIDAWDVDDNEQFLFYHDQGKNNIKKYNLEDNKFEKSIPLEDKGGLSNIVSINDTLLAILRGKFSDYKYLYFYYSTKGKIIEGRKKESVPHPGSWGGMTPVFKKAADNSIIYQPSESDTIFKINGTKMEPIISMRLEEPEKNGYTTKDYYVSFSCKTRDYIFLNKQKYETHITPSSSSFQFSDVEHLIYSLNTNKIYHINSIYYDALGIELYHSLSFPCENQLVIKYQAINFKKMIRKKLENIDLNEPKNDKLKQLNNEISENDNPILITGKYR